MLKNRNLLCEAAEISEDIFIAFLKRRWASGQRSSIYLQSSFTAWQVHGLWLILGCKEWRVFPAVAHIDVSKTGALINFSSGEAPFLEVQWPSKVWSVLLFPFAALWMLLQKLFQPAAAAWKCWASLFTQGAHNSNDESYVCGRRTECKAVHLTL